MADELTERYGELLTGSYDCVDRILLNAYYRWDTTRAALELRVRSRPIDSGICSAGLVQDNGLGSSFHPLA